MLIMLCAFCTDNNNHYFPVKDYQSLNIVAEVHETEIPLRIADNYDIELFGNSASCNLSKAGQPCITVSGVITQPDAMGSFNFEEGELLIESTTADCKMWGQFSGKGSLDGISFVINSDVEVTCGTGLFETKGGKLSMTITGLLPPKDIQSSTYNLTLYGELEK